MKTAGEVVQGRYVRTGRPVAIRVERGRIRGVTQLRKAPRGLPWVGPGLVDLQVNGFKGHDFNGGDVTAETVGSVTRALYAEGVTTYLPTVITNGDAAIEGAVRAIARAGARGIHLEGPFISPEDGPRGAHDKAFVKAPDLGLFRRWQDAAEGAIRIVTLSPEWAGASEFIARCASGGVTASIGHTAAAPQQVREAVAAGATMSTHLGNGCHRSLPRHHNYVWEQLAEDRLSAGLIADGFHLPPAVLAVFLRAKGERAFLVSDAVYLAGQAPGAYSTHIGGNVVLTPEGRLHVAGHPELLAGSAQGLARGIAHLAGSGLADLATAWEMASLRPAGFMGWPERKGLSPGAPADLVQFRWDGERIDVLRTYKRGEVVFNSGGRSHA